VRAILANPRYTGRQVWNRQRRDEVLLDVEDVAAGHETKLRWNDRARGCGLPNRCTSRS
jgi:site-specific DNA recombinase